METQLCSHRLAFLPLDLAPGLTNWGSLTSGKRILTCKRCANILLLGSTFAELLIGRGRYGLFHFLIFLLFFILLLLFELFFFFILLRLSFVLQLLTLEYLINISRLRLSFRLRANRRFNMLLNLLFFLILDFNGLNFRDLLRCLLRLLLLYLNLCIFLSLIFHCIRLDFYFLFFLFLLFIRDNLLFLLNLHLHLLLFRFLTLILVLASFRWGPDVIHFNTLYFLNPVPLSLRDQCFRLLYS